MKLHIHATVAASILLMTAMGAQAATVANYGDHPAVSVSYNQVTENTDIGLYQGPTIGGNTITFDPLGIKATAFGGSTVTNNAILNFDVQANPGKYINGLFLSESGDLTLTGSGTDATYADVTATFTVQILEVDGAPITPITDTFSIDDFSPNPNGTFELLTDNSPSGLIWDGDIYLPFADMLDGLVYTDGVTLANVNLANILVADSEAGSYANIHKKEAGGLSITSDVIPEPASAVLLIGTASLLTFIRRRIIG